MSGILGIWYHDGTSVEAAQLEAMATAIAHRGTDDAGFWRSNGLGFGHRMLWTTPQSLLDKLPLVQSAGTRVLTADLRLDNRLALIEQLDLRGRSPQDITDSQLVLAAYDRWGQACPEYLLGDFAFALWDGVAQHLFCARDHFGIKPFYYYASSRLFAFASELKALLTLPDIPRQLNEIRVADCLTATLEDPAITLYKGIWRLPAAHSLTLHSQQAPRLVQYWQLDRHRELQHPTPEAYAEEYRHHFAEAVRCRLSSAFPVGAHLSGGLDSSSVACMARHLSQKTLGGTPIHTFSHTYPEVPASDESEFIEIVLAQGGFIHHNIRGDVLGALTEWKALLRAIDASVVGNGYFNWIVNRAAQDNGVRILMSGFDGDTVIGHGFHFLTELARAGHWQAMIAEATQFIQRYRGAEASPRQLIGKHSLPVLKELAHARRWIAFAKAVHHLSPALQASPKHLWYEWGVKEMDGIRQWRHWRNKRRLSGYNPYPFTNPAFLAEIGYTQRLRSLSLPDPFPHSEREAQWQTLTSGLMVLPIEACDHLSAACGVETRHPFMDKRLVEYCLALPTHQKLNQGWTRAVMRRGMEGILPPEIQWRNSKGNSTAVFFHGLHRYDRPLLDELITQDLPKLARYLDLDHCKKVYHRILHENCPDTEGLWFILTFALWLRQSGL